MNAPKISLTATFELVEIITTTKSHYTYFLKKYLDEEGNFHHLTSEELENDKDLFEDFSCYCSILQLFEKTEQIPINTTLAEMIDFIESVRELKFYNDQKFLASIEQRLN